MNTTVVSIFYFFNFRIAVRIKEENKCKECFWKALRWFHSASGVWEYLVLDCHLQMSGWRRHPVCISRLRCLGSTVPGTKLIFWKFQILKEFYSIYLENQRVNNPFPKAWNRKLWSCSSSRSWVRTLLWDAELKGALSEQTRQRERDFQHETDFWVSQCLDAYSTFLVFFCQTSRFPGPCQL